MVSTEVEARLIAGRLRAYDIPAFVLSQVDSTRNLTVGALAVAKVFVPLQMMVRAEDILSMPAEELEELLEDQAGGLDGWEGRDHEDDDDEDAGTDEKESGREGGGSSVDN